MYPPIHPLPAIIVKAASERMEVEAVQAAPVNRKRRRSPRMLKVIDYNVERQDKEFAGLKGYSHFGRTRLGGDQLPRGDQDKIPLHVKLSVTMLNFFAPPGKQPIALPPTKKIREEKGRQAMKTRTKWGRPAKHDVKQHKILLMKSRMERTQHTGSIVVPPTGRHSWNGTVRNTFANMVVLFNFISCYCR